MAFEDIVNSENFGTLFRTNAGFRATVKKYMAHPSIAQMYPKMSVVKTRDNRIGFNYEPLGKNSVLSFNDALAASHSVSGSTLKSTRFTDSSTGAYANQMAKGIFKPLGLDVRITTHEMTEANQLQSFLDQQRTPSGDLYGMVIPRKDKVNVFDVFDQKGRRLLNSEIQEKVFKGLNTDAGALFKRLGIMTSDRALAIATSNGPGMRIGFFDSETFLKARDPNIAKKMRSIAQSEVDNGGTLGLEAYIKRAYDEAVDSISYLSPTGTERMLTRMGDEARREIATGDKVLGKARLELIRKQRRNNHIGGYSIFTQQGNTGIKGHAQVLSEQEFIEMARGMPEYRHWTDKKILADLDMVTAGAHRKTELDTIGNTFLLSLEPQSIGKKARSNPMSAATFGDEMGSVDFYGASARAEMAQGIADIKSGRITPGLKTMLAEMRDLDTIGMDEVEKIEAIKAKSFSNRILGMIENGVPINSSDHVTDQLFTALEKHHSRVKDGRRIEYKGIKGPNYEMSFPMEGSLRAHITNLSDPDQLGGMISYDEGSGRYRLAPADLVRNYGAFGGADYDDQIYNTLSYDKKTKRLLGFYTRDPNELGEKVLMDADITFMKGIPQEVRDLHAQNRTLTRQIARLSSAGDEAGVARLVRERDKISTTLDRYFSGKSIRIGNGEAISQSFIRQADYASEYSITDQRRFAAKGSATTAESIANYSQPSFMRSFHTSTALAKKGKTIRQLIDEEYAEDVTKFSGRMPWEYRGRGFSEFHEKYFSDFGKTFDEAAAMAAEVASQGSKAFDDFKPEVQHIVKRLAGEVSGYGNLGNAVLSQASIDASMTTMLTHLDDDGLKKFNQIFEKTKLPYVERERLIDSAVKEGAIDFNEAVSEMVTRRARLFGEAMGQMGEAGQMDPVSMQRFISNKTSAASYIEGFKAHAPEGLSHLMSETDLRASMSKYYQLVLDMKEESRGARKELLEGARANRINDLSGMNFTPEEITRASSFIETMESTRQEMASAFGSTPEEWMESLREIKETGQDIDIDLNAAGLRELHGYGLFDEMIDSTGELKRLGHTEALDRQLLAISHTLASNGASDSLLLEMGEEGVGAMGEMYMNALNRQVNTPKLLAEMDQMTSFDQLSKFITYNKKARTIGFTDAAKTMFDPAQRNISLLNRITTIANQKRYSEAASQRILDMANYVLDDLTRSGQVESEQVAKLASTVRGRLEYKVNANTVSPAVPYPKISYRAMGDSYAPPRAPGSRRLASREAADEVADEVSGIGKGFKEIGGTAAWKGLMAQPMARKGLIGAGLFAGFGILHRLAKDPSPEDMEGPPLLPGSGPYDDVVPSSFSAVNSMYSSVGGQNAGQSMIYQIQANGNFNPSELSSGLSGLTGTAVSGNVHSQRRVLPGRPSARELMQSYLGG